MNKKRVVAVISLLGLALLTYRSTKRKQKKRQVWSKSWLLRRNEGRGRGVLAMVKNELKNTDPCGYKNYLRMDNAVFNNLLNLIRTAISKEDTILRQCISAEDRLMVTLRYLATGETLRSLSFATRIAHNTLSVIINEVLHAIVNNLQEEYLKVPQTQEQWKTISKEFYEYWNFPNCIGAMDGKHILFRPLRKDGSFYHNYKGTDSIVLLAIVDAKYKFLMVDIGRNGRISDGGIFQRSPIAYAINNNTLEFPPPKCLPGRNKDIPHVLVADDAFPLKERIMKPYKFHGLSNEQRIYNYRICRARRIVENVFGILTNRFRILLNTMNVNVEKVVLITKVCCILHNYLMTVSPTYSGNIEDEDMTCHLQNLSQQGGNRSAKTPQEIRLEFQKYFNTTGAVPWQNESVRNNVM
ncbi:hypothetical protein RI129_002892 [Pyrocoelia pectoralis]|uniref:DDE Tnp4 domain-containing protein n=1 Tax=Pyrocoelia pectoralis TaxID=417401 RepID=A0AAN7VGU7_9COLE